MVSTTADGKLDFSADTRVQKISFQWPPDARPVTDQHGNTVYLFESDSEGEPILDEHGRKKPLIKNGQPVPKMTPQPDPEDQNEVWVKFTPLTRRIRMEAIDIATQAYMERHNKPGILISVLESAIVNRLVRASNIEGIPGKGFDNLADPALGDHIVHEMGIWNQLSGSQAVEEGKDESAKVASLEESAVPSAVPSIPTNPSPRAN